jgi:hypothetical protein
MGHREYWQFCQSGQFVHLSSFREDAWPNALQTALGKVLETPPIGEEPTGCVDVVEALFRLTEVHEFVAPLPKDGVRRRG